jgi:hypothetical protein
MPFTNRDSILLRRRVDKSFKPFKPYPSMVAAPQITAGAGSYELGTAVEIIPANTIATTFAIAKVQFAVLSDTGTYEVVLYANDTEEIGRTRIAGGTVGNAVLNIDMSTPIQAAGTKISAKIACAVAGSKTLYMSVIYQEIE